MTTREEVMRIINTEIPFNELEKNAGIFEFGEIDGVSFGVSYEDDDDGDVCYIYNYNLIYGEEYINISGRGSKDKVIRK